MTDTPDPITTAREALDKAYEVCRNLGGTDESDFHAIATVFDLVEKLKAERDEALAELALRRPSDKDVAQTREARQQYREKLKELYGNADALPMEIARLKAENDDLKAKISLAVRMADGLISENDELSKGPRICL